MNDGTTLTDAIRLWSTPTAGAGGNSSRGNDRKGEPLLGGQAKNWPTPNTKEDMSVSMKSSQMNGTRKSVTLGRLVANWPTPNASDGDKITAASTNGATLPREATFFRQDRTISEAGNPTSKSFRRLTPLFVEALMGYPLGWSIPMRFTGPTDSAAWATLLSQIKERMRSGS